MSDELVTFPSPVTVEEAVASLPDLDKALGWGVQSMTRDTVRAMVLLASSRSEHYRYALAVSLGIAQYLYDMPEGAVAGREHFIRCNQNGSLIGHFDNLETHVIQEPLEKSSENEEEYMMLLVLDDNHQVDSYLLTRLRDYSDHVVINNILPKNTAL